VLCYIDWQLVTDVSGQPIGSIFKSLGFMNFEDGPMGCTETLVTNYQSVLCNMPEEGRSQLHTKLKSGTLSARGRFVGLGIDGIVILKMVLKTDSKYVD
jgi:hypothetical protein